MPRFKTCILCLGDRLDQADQISSCSVDNVFITHDILTKNSRPFINRYVVVNTFNNPEVKMCLFVLNKKFNKHLT
jgi:hypothetical protein